MLISKGGSSLTAPSVRDGTFWKSCPSKSADLPPQDAELDIPQRRIDEARPGEPDIVSHLIVND